MTADEDDNLKGLESTIGHHLRLAYQLQVQRFVSAVGAPFHIRASEFAILKLIHDNPGVRQMQLTRALSKKHANIVTALDGLERRKLVSRDPDPQDKRSRVLNLTPSGRKLAVKLLDRHAKLTKDLERRFGKRKLSQLLSLLREFHQLEAEPKIDDSD